MARSGVAASQSELGIESDRRLFALGLVVSLALHGGLLVLISMGLARWDKRGDVESEGPVREVGLYVKQPSTAEQERTETNESPHTASEAPFSSDRLERFSEPSERDSSAESLLKLPDPPSRLLGPGPGVPAFSTADPRDVIRSGGAASPATLPSDAGQVSFFGASDRGERVVYVLDSSGSMSNHNAIIVAKQRLLASLSRLQSTQQFQVIFYNTTPYEMPDRNGRTKLFWATSVNRTLARQFVEGIQPAGGTRHMRALQAALKYSPDVIFFLTDADQPRLSAGELADIRRRNNGRTRIHCIEFGEGRSYGLENFLKRLAEQNGGTYRYVDVTQFDGR